MMESNRSVRSQDIQDIDIVEFPVADMNEARDGTAQVEQGVQLDRSLGLAKRGPGKQRQAKIDGGGVQRIHSVGQIHRQRFVRIKLAGDDYQSLSKFVVDAPVARLVGIGQCAATDVATYAKIIKLRGLCPQTGLNVA